MTLIGFVLHQNANICLVFNSWSQSLHFLQVHTLVFQHACYVALLIRDKNTDFLCVFKWSFHSFGFTFGWFLLLGSGNPLKQDIAFWNNWYPDTFLKTRQPCWPSWRMKLTCKRYISLYEWKTGPLFYNEILTRYIDAFKCKCVKWITQHMWFRDASHCEQCVCGCLWRRRSVDNPWERYHVLLWLRKAGRN